MAFTYDLTTDAGKVRLIIADTDSSAYAYEDAEIAYFLTAQSDDVTKAAYMAVRGLLADRARRVKRATMAGIAYDDTAQVSALRDLLAELGKNTSADMPTITAVSPVTLPMDEAYIEVAFTRGA